MAHAKGVGLPSRKRVPVGQSAELNGCYCGIGPSNKWWNAEPGLDRVADAVAYRVDRIRAIGNGQIPVVADSAFRFLSTEES